MSGSDAHAGEARPAAGAGYLAPETARRMRRAATARHYYRVQGPGLLIEHDNTQGHGNHVQSVWRVPGGDFGDDLLAAHYRAEQHQGHPERWPAPRGSPSFPIRPAVRSAPLAVIRRITIARRRSPALPAP